jgi:hypothetical protein
MRKLAPVAVIAFALSAAAAHADGLPVTGIDAGPIGLSDGTARYLALPAGPGTVLAKADPKSGSVTQSLWLPEKLTIPTVALDGSATGLARNAPRLVLIRPRRTFPQRATRFAIVDTRKLRMRRFVLEGDFSFDALSPDGRTAYLINYTSKKDFTEYAVRALDLETRKLVPGEIVDPREPDEDMSGWPITRAYSPDGRWAYTLYDGTEGHPFIHALDTVNREARCIDLDDLAKLRSDHLYDLKLRAAGERLEVLGADGAVATVDTRTHELTTAVVAVAPARQESSIPLWPGAAAALLAGAALALRRRSG